MEVIPVNAGGASPVDTAVAAMVPATRPHTDDYLSKPPHQGFGAGASGRQEQFRMVREELDRATSAAPEVTARLAASDRALLRSITGEDFETPSPEAMKIVAKTIATKRVADLAMSGEKIDPSIVEAVINPPGKSVPAIIGRVERLLSQMIHDTGYVDLQA